MQATGPFIKLGPLRNVDGVAEIAGILSAAGLVLILTACLTIYGAAKFQQDKSQVGVKTLSGASSALSRADIYKCTATPVLLTTAPLRCGQADSPRWSRNAAQ